MDARYGMIRGEHEEAERSAPPPSAEVAEYEAALAGSAGRGQRPHRRRPPDARGRARARLAEVNAAIAARRAAAAAEAERPDQAARATIEDAVADVATAPPS